MTVPIGLSLMLEDAWREAALPLFERGDVDALEWSFDQAWRRPLPSWAAALLDHYAAADRLWGHGVTMSPGSVDAGDRHEAWLQRLQHELPQRRLRGVSEHFGFMVAGAIDLGAPLPLPDGPGARAVLRRNLARLAAVAGVPVGIENLALALCRDDAWQQGPMLADVLAHVDGYLVLDLHNLWCQLVNFELDPLATLQRYPLQRARCIHVSGGSWWGEARFRRDTHDDEIPEPVLALLQQAVPLCPALEVVVIERLGETLVGHPDALQRDLERVRARLGAA
ncbi:MAG: DUF692 domain-containing protein [Nannocystaceae bacterium]|nr:DUF692 domain-containing protein [Nannocystaceae bacterium]